MRRVIAAGLTLALSSACASPAPPPTATLVPSATVPPSATPLPSATLVPSATPLASPTVAPSPAPDELSVDAAQALGPISPLIYGSNYGPWLSVGLETRPAALAARITLLRFPGGNWGDQNNVQTYQVDQFIAFAREMGSEPFINVRLAGGTPEQAAALVQYANVTQNYHVRYWAIGNEPSLYPNYDTEQFNRDWAQWAEAMRAVDPNIVLVGPEIHQFTANSAGNPKDSAGRDWMTEFLRANGDRVDMVSIHRYAFPNNSAGTPPTIDQLRSNSSEWDAIIPYLRALIREQTGRDLPVAVTEVNSSWATNVGGPATMDSLYNAIWWADSLGRMMRQGTDMVAQFALAGRWGLMDSFNLYPIYGVYLLYQHFGDTRVQAAAGVADLSLYAARREDGALTLMLVNLGPEAITHPLRLAGFAPAGPAEEWRLDATYKGELLGTAEVADGTVLTLPGQSVTLYVVPGAQP